MPIESKGGSRERSGPQLVQALSRGLGILSQFTGESRELSLAELSRRTGLHKGTVFRFVKTLEADSYLTYNSESGLYSVGPAWAAAWSFVAQSRRDSEAICC